MLMVHLISLSLTLVIFLIPAAATDIILRGFVLGEHTVLFSINLVNNVLEKVYPTQASEFTLSAITSSVIVVRHFFTMQLPPVTQ